MLIKQTLCFPFDIYCYWEIFSQQHYLFFVYIQILSVFHPWVGGGTDWWNCTKHIVTGLFCLEKMFFLLGETSVELLFTVLFLCVFEHLTHLRNPSRLLVPAKLTWIGSFPVAKIWKVNFQSWHRAMEDEEDEAGNSGEEEGIRCWMGPRWGHWKAAHRQQKASMQRGPSPARGDKREGTPTPF